MRIAFVTFGCRLNRAEALDAEARFAAAGHQVVALDATPPPECIVVRGCSVTAKAQRDSEKEIARLRRRHPQARVVATGCLPVAEALDVPKVRPDALPRTTSRAYLKVQDGCSGHCAFCVVPRFRGQPRSVPFADVLARAQAFLAAGFRELVVTGCNIALYRDGGRGIADLLAALAGLPPPNGCDGETPTASGTVHRVRIGSLEPGLCGDEVVDAIAAHPNICRFIHLSLQSASDRILKLMNRPYTAEGVAQFCRRTSRRLGTRCAWGADVIAGFPSETEADHRETLRFLGAQLEGLPPFVNLHVFPYSERPETPAALMPNAIPQERRRLRARELEELGARNRAAFARSLVGKDVMVCIEKDGDGWTSEYLRFHAPPGFMRRQLAVFRVAAVVGDELYPDTPTAPSPQRHET